MSLPLNVKRAVRDAEPLHKKFEESCSAAVGFPVTVAFDHAAVYAKLTAAQRDNAVSSPTILAENYLPPILQAITSFSKKGEDSKAALAEAWSTKKLTVAFVEKKELTEADKTKLSGDYYNAFRFNDGNLEFVTSTESWWCNVDDISRFDLSPLFSAGGMPLSINVSWKDSKPDVDAKVKKIRDTVGIADLELDVDFKSVYSSLKKQYGDDSYHNINKVESVGNYLSSSIIAYLDCLQGCLETACKDDMVKEAIQESVSSKKIAFKVVPAAEFEKYSSAIKKNSSNYVSAGFENGNINIYARLDRYYSNIDDLRFIDLSTLF